MTDGDGGYNLFTTVDRGFVVSKSFFSSALKRKVSSTAGAQASTHHIMSLSCQFREGQPKNLQLQPHEREDSCTSHFHTSERCGKCGKKSKNCVHKKKELYYNDMSELNSINLSDTYFFSKKKKKRDKCFYINISTDLL